MKKIIAVMIVLLTIVMIVGCSKTDAKTAAAKVEGKVTVWCWDPNFNGYSMKEAAAVYAKIQPKVTVEIVDIPDNIEGKIEAGLQAGGAGLPDIALFQDYIIEKFVKNYPGAFADLKAAGVDYSKFAQYKVGPMTDGSKIYGIPFDTGSTGLWLRADLIKQAGLNPDDYQKNLTWTDVVKLGQTVKAKTGKPLIAYDSTSFDTLRIIVQSTGTQFFKDDGTLNFDAPAILNGIAGLKLMNDNGLLFMAEGWNNWVAALNGGDSAGFLNAIWMVGTVKSKPENAGKWMVVPTPLLEGTAGAANASNNGGSSWYVFEKAPNKAAAIDFLKNVWASDTPDALGFYNTILKGAGAMGTYLPSRTGSNYTAPDEFFYNSQPVYKDFSTWMEKVPVLKYTPNYTAMRDTLRNALNRMFAGELKTPQDVVAAAAAEYKQTTGL